MIYCVEDESAIRDLMVYTLKVSGFEAQGFEDSVDFWLAMKAQNLSLLYWMLCSPVKTG
jgi:two-component system alkaline phosphatase synthesis response regulator PhoP